MALDVLDPELYRGDPHPDYAWLRKNDPIHWDARRELWILTRYEHVVHVSKHPRLFCSGRGVRPGNPTPLSIVTMDEPRHTQLRRLVNRGFTPRMVGLLQPRIEAIVAESLARVLSRGQCDFVADVAVVLPLLVIAEMLGIRSEDRERFWHWSDHMIAADGHYDDPEVMARASRAYGEYAAYLKDVFADRRRRPQEDLVSVLVNASDDGLLSTNEDTLTDDELVMFMTLLLVAGNETTRNAISGGMIALLEDPEERAKLCARPELLASAVEEILRWTSPVINFMRTATQDTSLGEKPIRAGQRVMLFYASANRDEVVFPEADRFRVDRQPNPHVAFGIGNHFCLGANLARLEIRKMFEALIPHLEDVRLAPGGQPVYAPSSFVRGVESLPIVFASGAARAQGSVP